MNEEQITDEALKADESQIEVESPATEQDSIEPIEEKVEETSTEVEETTGTQREEGRKTAESRIRELVAEKKEAEAKAESLAEQVKKFTAPQPFTYTPPIQDDSTELTVDEVLKKADALTQIRLAQQANIYRVQQEASEAMKAHPELDTDSDSFDPDLSEAISKATLSHIQANPTASVKDFVNGLMKPYKRAVEKEASGQAEAKVKQASQQAVRPTQVREQEKPFSELSIEEMEKRLEKVRR